MPSHTLDTSISSLSSLKEVGTTKIPEGKTYTSPSDEVKEVSSASEFPTVFDFSTTASTTQNDVEFSTLLIRKDIKKALDSSGAVLLRGFLKDFTSGSNDTTKTSTSVTAENFATVMESMGWSNYHYIGGAAPRTPVVGDSVFTTNESPPSEPVPFHHELGQVEKPPNYICFFCERPAEKGGETPILFSPAVSEYVKREFPEVADRLEKLGVRYTRVMPAVTDTSSAIGRSWRDTFGVSNRKECEKKLVDQGYSFRWLKEDSEESDLETTTKKLNVFTDYYQDGRCAFRNSIIAAFTGWIDSRNDPKQAVKYGDGSPLDSAVMQSISDFMQREKVVFEWKRGDILLLNNNLAMHSRATFVNSSTQTRRVLASMWGPELNSTNNAVTKLPISGIPSLGYGFWKIPKADTARMCIRAIAQGYRHLDCACDYGNEKEVGEGIKIATEVLGLCTREDLWVTSKLWNTYHAKQHVEPACKKTLGDLGLDYLDLYIIHFPISLKYVPFEQLYPPEWVNPETKKMTEDIVPLHETWPAMESLVEKKLVKQIGLANHSTALIRDLFGYCKIKPTVLQVELHPYNTQEKLLRFCKEHSIDVTGFSPLGAASYIEMDWTTKKDAVMYTDTIQNIINHPKQGAEDAERRCIPGKTGAQITLKWGIQRGCSVIPKSMNVNRMKQNIDLFEPDFVLSEGEMREISELNINRRFNDPGVFAEGMGCFCPIYD